MIAKSTAAGAAQARDLLVRLHPYEIPCVTVIPILAEVSNPAFISWVAGEMSIA